jgi:hypothetical protein
MSLEEYYEVMQASRHTYMNWRAAMPRMILTARKDDMTDWHSFRLLTLIFDVIINTLSSRLFKLPCLFHYFVNPCMTSCLHRKPVQYCCLYIAPYAASGLPFMQTRACLVVCIVYSIIVYCILRRFCSFRVFHTTNLWLVGCNAYAKDWLRFAFLTVKPALIGCLLCQGGFDWLFALLGVLWLVVPVLQILGRRRHGQGVRDVTQDDHLHEGGLCRGQQGIHPYYYLTSLTNFTGFLKTNFVPSYSFFTRRHQFYFLSCSTRHKEHQRPSLLSGRSCYYKKNIGDWYSLKFFENSRNAQKFKRGIKEGCFLEFRACFSAYWYWWHRLSASSSSLF